MLVLVAVGALGKVDLEERRPPRGNVALLALNGGMFSLERISAGSVLFHGECRWLEPIDRVAARTFSAVGTFYKLSAVRIRLVAIAALRMRDRPLKVRPDVAALAAHAGVFSEQRVCRLRVIELCAQRLAGHLFPAACSMTGLACSRHRSAVWISVTGVAAVENQAAIFRLAVGARRVAFLTGHLRV